MATKAKKNPLEERANQPALTFQQIRAIWAGEGAATDHDVYEAVADARLHALTGARIAELLGVSRQQVHKQYWKPFADAPEHQAREWDVAPIDEDFDPAEDVPLMLATVIERREATRVDAEDVFRAIVAYRIDTGASMAEVAEELGRKREQVYRDYWTPWAAFGGQAIAQAEAE